MSRIKATIMVLGAVWTTCSAVTNDLQGAIRSFCRIEADRYRPDEAVRSANILIGAGKDAASAALHLAATAEHDFDRSTNEKVCHLCRLLFLPTNTNEPLRPARLGSSPGMPYESMRPPDWPDLPFAIIDDVPLSLNLGYALGGLPESGESYLAYCQANGSFRTR